MRSTDAMTKAMKIVNLDSDDEKGRYSPMLAPPSGC